MGDVYQAEGNFQKAIAQYQAALSQLIPELPATPLHAIPTVSTVKVEQLQVMRNLRLKGTSLRTQFEKSEQIEDLQLALQHFDTLSLLTDRLRFSVLADDSKINLARQIKVAFEEAIKVCLRLYEETGEQAYAERAFSFAEKSKAIVLLEAIKETRARHFAGLDAADLKREKELKQSIAELELNIYREQRQDRIDQGKLQQWNQELIAANETYEQLLIRFEQQSPKYHQLKYDQHALSVADIQNHPDLLQDDQALLEFFVGKDFIYTFQISRNDFRVNRIPLRFSLATKVDTFRQSINQFLKDPEKNLPILSEYGLMSCTKNSGRL